MLTTPLRGNLVVLRSIAAGHRCFLPPRTVPNSNQYDWEKYCFLPLALHSDKFGSFIALIVSWLEALSYICYKGYSSDHLQLCRRGRGAVSEMKI